MRLGFLVWMAITVLHTSARANVYDSISKQEAPNRYWSQHLAFTQIEKNPEEIDALRKHLVEKGLQVDVEVLDHYVAMQQTTSDSTKLKLLDAYIHNMQQRNEVFLLAEAYMVRSYIYQEQKEHKKALVNAMQAFQFLKQDSNYFHHASLLLDIAFQYYLYQDYDNAIAIGKIACFMKQPKLMPWAEVLHGLYASDLIGSAYLRKENYDSAIVWFQKNYKIADSNRVEVWCGIASGKEGSALYLQGKLKESVPYLLRGNETCVRVKLWDNVTPFSSYLADCYLRRLQLDSARYFLTLAHDAAYKDGSEENLSFYYGVASRYYHITAQSALANACQDSFEYYTKRALDKYNVNEKIKIEAQWDSDKERIENAVYQEKVAKQKWIAYAVVISVGALCLGVIIWRKQKLLRRLRSKMERKSISHSVE